MNTYPVNLHKSIDTGGIFIIVKNPGKNSALNEIQISVIENGTFNWHVASRYEPQLIQNVLACNNTVQLKRAPLKSAA